MLIVEFDIIQGHLERLVIVVDAVLEERIKGGAKAYDVEFAALGQ